MVKDEAVSRVRATVNVQDQRIFFCGIKVRRLLYPRMNFLAVKTCVPDLFRRGQVELGEKLVIDVGELARLRARLPAVNPEQIADIRRRRDEHDESRSVFICAKTFHCLVAARDLSDLGGSNVNLNQISAAFTRSAHDQAVAVARPHNMVWASGAWCALVAAHAAANVKVVAGG